MNWNSLSEFLEMGGYGLYVWGSFGMTAAAMGWELLMVAHRHRRALREARALSTDPGSDTRESTQGDIDAA
jgi:heme exporter protein D